MIFACTAAVNVRQISMMPLLTTFRSKFGLNLSNNIAIRINKALQTQIPLSIRSEEDA
jgi:hypothetical protein